MSTQAISRGCIESPWRRNLIWAVICCGSYGVYLALQTVRGGTVSPGKNNNNTWAIVSSLPWDVSRRLIELGKSESVGSLPKIPSTQTDLLTWMEVSDPPSTNDDQPFLISVVNFFYQPHCKQTLYIYIIRHFYLLGEDVGYVLLNIISWFFR